MMSDYCHIFDDAFGRSWESSEVLAMSEVVLLLRLHVIKPAGPDAHGHGFRTPQAIRCFVFLGVASATYFLGDRQAIFDRERRAPGRSFLSELCIPFPMEHSAMIPRVTVPR